MICSKQHVAFLYSFHLALISLKQLLRSAELGVKDLFVIRQYGSGFRSFLVEIQILKIVRVELHVQLRKMRLALVNR